jgi:hypothetical protein
MGKFSCVYMNLSNFKLFPFVEPTASISGLLKHTEVTQLSTNHLKHTTNWKDMVDPIRGTLLPNFFIVYFGQEIPQGSITSDDDKTTMAKLGSGYDLCVSTVSDAIDYTPFGCTCAIRASSRTSTARPYERRLKRSWI